MYVYHRVCGMRPRVNVERYEVYECPACGARAEESGVCEPCGTELLAIGTERDL